MVPQNLSLLAHRPLAIFGGLIAGHFNLEKGYFRPLSNLAVIQKLFVKVLQKELLLPFRPKPRPRLSMTKSPLKELRKAAAFQFQFQLTLSLKAREESIIFPSGGLDLLIQIHLRLVLCPSLSFH